MLATPRLNTARWFALGGVLFLVAVVGLTIIGNAASVVDPEPLIPTQPTPDVSATRFIGTNYYDMRDAYADTFGFRFNGHEGVSPDGHTTVLLGVRGGTFRSVSLTYDLEGDPEQAGYYLDSLFDWLVPRWIEQNGPVAYLLEQLMERGRLFPASGIEMYYNTIKGTVKVRIST